MHEGIIETISTPFNASIRQIQPMIGNVVKHLAPESSQEGKKKEGNTDNIITTQYVNFLEGREQDNNIKRNLSKTFPTQFPAEESCP